MKNENIEKQKKAKKQNEAVGMNEDIVHLILEDHKPLKELIKTMKDSDKSEVEREAAFLKFAPLLAVHAKAEEEVLYVFMKKNKDLIDDAFEGDVEHGLADQMLTEAKAIQEKHLRNARIKVLAELVEHHIEEEENNVLPEFEKSSAKPQRLALGSLYSITKQNIKGNGQEKDPSFVPLQ